MEEAARTTNAMLRYLEPSCEQATAPVAHQVVSARTQGGPRRRECRALSPYTGGVGSPPLVHSLLTLSDHVCDCGLCRHLGLLAVFNRGRFGDAVLGLVEQIGQFVLLEPLDRFRDLGRDCERRRPAQVMQARMFRSENMALLFKRRPNLSRLGPGILCDFIP